MFSMFSKSKMTSNSSLIRDYGPATEAAESSDGYRITRFKRYMQCNRTWLTVNGVSFFILCVVCATVSQLIPTPEDRGFFDPACVDGANDPAEENFHLDLTFGNFSFTQAKLIDITWDTTVGQGGRLLHGWVLYRTVIHPLLVFAMETSSVTYNYYTTLSFSRASLETFWTLLSTLFMTDSYSVLICSILAVYAVGYTIFFPIIFSAATGYINQAHKLYAMDQGDVITLDSEHLSLCWVIDPLRLGLSNTSGVHVEIGPNFSSIQSTIQRNNYTNNHLYFNVSQRVEGFEYTPGGWKHKDDISIWDHLEDYSGRDKVSRNFADIRAYALTTQLLQISLNAPEWYFNGSKANLNSMSLTKSGETTTRVDWYSINESRSIDTSNYAISPSLEALDYLGPAHLRANSSTSPMVHIAPFDETGFEKMRWTYFHLDESIDIGPGVLPYNSTIWINGRAIPLAAPFLDVGYNCSGNTAFTKLGNCVCYKGKPIPADLLGSEKTICNAAPGYVWGFSSYLTRLGLILEAVWMGCCFICYLRLSLRSDIIHKEPLRTAGILRLALDCSDSACNDLGPEVASLSESALMSKLRQVKISYQTQESEHTGEIRYRVVSGKEKVGFKNRFAHWEGRLAKRLDDRFERINARVDPVSESMNIKFNQATTRIKEKYGSTKSLPSEVEVYEDLNWRVY